MKVGRNDPCHCGSGAKYKKCCLAADDARRAEAAAQAASEARAAAASQSGGPGKKGSAPPASIRNDRKKAGHSAPKVPVPTIHSRKV